MSKPKAQEEFAFDSRIIQRNIRDGRVSRNDYEQHVASLPDLENQCETLSPEIFSSSHSVALAGEFISNEQDE